MFLRPAFRIKGIKLRKGKKELPWEKHLGPTTNSLHIWRWRQDLNPGQTGGRRLLSLLRHFHGRTIKKRRKGEAGVALQVIFFGTQYVRVLHCCCYCCSFFPVRFFLTCKFFPCPFWLCVLFSTNFFPTLTPSPFLMIRDLLLTTNISTISISNNGDSTVVAVAVAAKQYGV